MEKLKVRIKRTEACRDLPLPKYETTGSSGMDLLAAVDEPTTLNPMEVKLIPTGISISLPSGYEAQVRPRSGLAIRHQIGILNAPGTIDSDYRGEIRVILFNLGNKPFTIHRGDRIAQLVVSKVERIEWEEVDELDGTQRGAGGFGHSGIKIT